MADDAGHTQAVSARVPNADGAPAEPAQAATGWVIAGRYRVLDRLGSGAMADVFRAHDEILNRNVAVKVFRTLADPDSETNGAARRQLELQALAQLSHPNLITLFDGSVADDGPSFLALELVEGPNLAALLQNGPLSEPQVRVIGAQIADALAYVHERGMVHRDVKPANILLGTDDADDPDAMRARLSDFGIVRLVDSAQMTSADLTVGTAYYLAPEQARSANVGPPADVYSLGLVLIEALTGARSFEGTMHEVLLARLTSVPAIPAGLPEPWPALLAAMTASDPADRPAAAEVARALRTGDATAITAAFPAAGAAAAAGLAGAGVAGAAALADMPTAAASPVGAAAAAATGPIATGPVPGGPPPPGGRPPRGPARHDGKPHRSRKVNTLLLASVVFLAIIAGAGWMLFGPSSQPTNQPPTVPKQQPGSSSSTALAQKHSRHSDNGGPVPVNESVPASSSQAGGPGTSRSPSASASTSAARSSSAASSRPAPSTSHSVTSSSPPPTRSSTASSPAPSTSASTQTTSSAATTTAPSPSQSSQTSQAANTSQPGPGARSSAVSQQA
ncbi:MAG TPA: serine/threonine-protein kinase [Jatrophihabitans sp.]|nr:serine/threonine-protein kinase [Jatrophihabitans sp.]